MNIGIIGAGTMGSGIAQAFAQVEGNNVLLADLSLDLAVKGKERITKGLQKRVDAGKMEQEAADLNLNRIFPVEKSAFSNCDLVVEAVLESMPLKKETFAALDAIAKSDCLFYQFRRCV